MENIRGNKPVNAIHSGDGLKDEGITLREHFAGLAMQANIIHHGTHGGCSFSEKQCAEHSIAQADALLKELDK